MRKSTSEKTLPETINIKNPSEDEKSTLQQQDWFCELVSTYTEHKINALEKENQNLIQKLLALKVDQRYIKFLESIPSLMQKQQEHNKQGNSDNEYKKLNEKLDEVIDDYEDVKRKLKKAEAECKKTKDAFVEQHYYNEENIKEITRKEEKVREELATLNGKYLYEKESFLKQVSELTKERDQLNDQISIYKTRNDPALLMNDFSDNTVKKIHDEYVTLKSHDLNSFVGRVVEEHSLSEDQEFDFDLKIVAFAFKTVRKLIEETYSEMNFELIGKKLTNEESERNRLIETLVQTIAKMEEIGKNKKLQQAAREFITKLVKFYCNMFLIDKKLELVWASTGSLYNPEWYDSRNATSNIVVTNVVKPALMDTFTKTVYEKGIVETTQKRKK